MWAFVVSDFPYVVDIKRHSLEDGPGIRTVVFFKGCPLRCVFCQNPETQSKTQELGFYENECIGCFTCVEVCPKKACRSRSSFVKKLLRKPGKPIIDRNLCDVCGLCVDRCPTRALRILGVRYSVSDLTEVLLRDLPFYSHSGGGVTLSGGECALYPDYCGELLAGLKYQGVRTAIETAGHFDYDAFKTKMLPYLDLVMFDIKVLDQAGHEKYCGYSNEKILENFKSLMREVPRKIHPRVPLIPEVTTSRENLTAIVRFLKSLGAESVTLLPYNPSGFEKCSVIGRKRPSVSASFMKPEKEQEIFEMFGQVLTVKKGQK